jgi:hypothetical protein
MLAQVVTNHEATILVNTQTGEVVSAACDSSWDMIKNQDLPVYIYGYVVSGGDNTPADGPQDSPRTFVYKVQKDDGTFVEISYLAYPPSPAGDAYREKVTLDFYAGLIRIGDRIDASGMLNKDTGIIEATYIHTSVPRKEVVGQIISGGDTTLPIVHRIPRAASSSKSRKMTALSLMSLIRCTRLHQPGMPIMPKLHSAFTAMRLPKRAII